MIFVALLGLWSCGDGSNGSGGTGGTGGTAGTGGVGGSGGVGGTGGTGGTVPTGCPTTLVTFGGWFQTPPDTDIRGFSSIEASITFQNITGVPMDVEFTQLWSLPNVEEGFIALSNFPINGVANGAEFTITLLLDVTVLSDTETGFAIRPTNTQFGTMGPDQILFVSAEFTCEP